MGLAEEEAIVGCKKIVPDQEFHVLERAFEAIKKPQICQRGTQVDSNASLISES